LVDAGEIDFSRILGGRNVRVFGVKNVQTGVKRHSLAATGGTGHEDHALRFGQVLKIGLSLHHLITECIDAQHRAGRVQNTGDHLFAEQRWTRAHAEIDGAVLRQAHLDAAVLRYTALGDIEARHDLEAGDDLDGELNGRHRDFFQDTVESSADAEGL